MPLRIMALQEHARRKTVTAMDVVYVRSPFSFQRARHALSL